MNDINLHYRSKIQAYLLSKEYKHALYTERQTQCFITFAL